MVYDKKKFLMSNNYIKLKIIQNYLVMEIYRDISHYI